MSINMNPKDMKIGDQFLVTNGWFGKLCNKPEVHVYVGKMGDRYEFAIYVGNESMGSGSPTAKDLQTAVFHFEKIDESHPNYLKNAVAMVEFMTKMMEAFGELQQKEDNGEKLTDMDIMQTLGSKLFSK